ncbi:hypothetical protein SH580_12085 [Coraliomargarita algicola]|uniref:Uncharacterized protein n=1 Tax=Coraliomargarita algicola TaxID=3092156 RepID=A0ABZ0RDX5_9BACT|nr:hypothetical protein [Coraliomargarita sp. J2-16]WPJ94172.1 hypothetical protein SH580_12085 [Coraliomargarita sp. J2-16]
MLQLVVTLSFHAGQLDQRFVSRYSLPFHVSVVSATVLILAYAAIRWRSALQVACFVTGIFILVYTLPSNDKSIFNHSNFVVREFNWFEELAQEEFAPRSLYVDRYVVFWSLQDLSVVPIPRVLKRVPKVLTYLEREVFDEIYVIRRAKYVANEFQSIDPEFDDLQQILNLELVAEKSFKPLQLTQVYRVQGLQPNVELTLSN